MNRLDYSEFYALCEKHGIDPTWRGVEVCSSGECMDGSRTLTLYFDGGHVFSCFVPAIEEEEEDWS